MKTATENLHTLSLQQKVIIAVAVIGWAILLANFGDVNFAQPIVEMEQEK